MSAQTISRVQTGLIGDHAMKRMTGEMQETILASVSAHSPVLAESLVGHAFGKIIGETTLGYGERELETITMLGAMGGCESQLRTHPQPDPLVSCRRFGCE